MRTMTIRIERDERTAQARMKAGFVRASKSGKYQGEHRSFESPAALFRVLTPVRWTLIERLQALGPSTLRGLRERESIPVAGMVYVFSTPDQLMADFNADIARWNDEHGRS